MGSVLRQMPGPRRSAVTLPGDAVWIQLITTLGTIATIIVTWWLNRRSREQDKKEAIAARAEQTAKIDVVVEQSNGHSIEKDRQIVALKKEIARIQGVGYTPEPGNGAPVTIDSGVVAVAEKQ